MGFRGFLGGFSGGFRAVLGGFRAVFNHEGHSKQSPTRTREQAVNTAVLGTETNLK